MAGNAGFNGTLAATAISSINTAEINNIQLGGKIQLTNSNQNIYIGKDNPTATVGSKCIAIGEQAGEGFNSNVSYSIAIGYQALEKTGGSGLVEGSQNIGIGYQAGQEITSGIGNLCLGHISGQAITTGGSNIMLGRYANVDNGARARTMVLGKYNAGDDDTTYISCGSTAAGTNLYINFTGAAAEIRPVGYDASNASTLTMLRLRGIASKADSATTAGTITNASGITMQRANAQYPPNQGWDCVYAGSVNIQMLNNGGDGNSDGWYDLTTVSNTADKSTNYLNKNLDSLSPQANNVDGLTHDDYVSSPGGYDDAGLTHSGAGGCYVLYLAYHNQGVTSNGAWHGAQSGLFTFINRNINEDFIDYIMIPMTHAAHAFGGGQDQWYDDNAYGSGHSGGNSNEQNIPTYRMQARVTYDTTTSGGKYNNKIQVRWHTPGMSGTYTGSSTIYFRIRRLI